MKDYYEILNVKKDATANEIKKSFKKLAKQYHPDRNPNNKEAEEKFKEINEAYEILGDEEKRKNYDMYGDPKGEFEDIDMSQIYRGFKNMFRRGFTGFEREKRVGTDLLIQCRISFKDSVNGVKKTVKFKRHGICDECKGSGSADGKRTTCPVCNGFGVITEERGDKFYRIVEQHTCPKCFGAGKIMTNPCKKCSGKGFSEIEKELEVEFPAGAFSGMKLRVVGEGNEDVDGNGNLYIDVVVEKDPYFVRNGNDVYLEYNMTYPQAVLGDKIQVPTIYGKSVEVSIPKGSQPGRQLKIREKGFRDIRSGFKGDMYVILKLKIPTNPSEEYVKCVEELKKIES